MKKLLALILAVTMACGAPAGTGPNGSQEFAQAFCDLDAEYVAEHADPRYMSRGIQGVAEARAEGLEWCTSIEYFGTTQTPSAPDTHSDHVFGIETSTGYYWYVFTQDNETGLFVAIE